MGSVMISSQSRLPNPAINTNAGFELWMALGTVGTSVTKTVPHDWKTVNAIATRKMNSIALTRITAGVAHGIRQEIPDDLSKSLRGKHITLSVGTPIASTVNVSIPGLTPVSNQVTGTTNNSVTYVVPDNANALSILVTMPAEGVSSFDLLYCKLEVGQAATPYVTPSLEDAIAKYSKTGGKFERINVTGQTVNMNTITSNLVERTSLYLVCKSAEGSSNITNIPRPNSSFLMDIDVLTAGVVIQKIVYPDGEVYIRSSNDGVFGSWKFITALTELNGKNDIRFWLGTKDEYDQIADKDPNTYYIVTDGVGESSILAAIGAAPAIHDHDGRYYTTAEIDALINNGSKIHYTILDKPSPSPSYAITDMTDPRTHAAAMGDLVGNVIVAGGFNGAVPTGSVDRYESSYNRISLSPLSVGRSHLKSARDGSGNILFGGGFAGSYRDTVDRYEPSGTRTVLTVMSIARGLMGAATDGAGNVLFGGGWTGSVPTNVVDKYTPAGTRSALTTLSNAAQNLGAATDGDGNVLFGGGTSSSGTYLSSVDRYSPSGVKTTLGALSVGRTGPSASADGDGSVLFGGGFNGAPSNTVDKYTSSGAKITLSPLSVPRYWITSVTDSMGNVLFGGGSDGGATRYDTVDCYSVAGIRTSYPPLSEARGAYTAATNSYGDVFFFGGQQNSTGVILESAEVYPKNPIIKIKLPLGASYKFNEHPTEQTATSDIIVVKATDDNSGYIRFDGTVDL